MRRVHGYTVGEQLHEGSRMRVSRAVRERDRQPVILKEVRSPYPTDADVESLRHELAMLRSIDCAGVVKAHELLEHRGGVALVLEDIGAESMVGRSADLSLPAKVDLAMRFAESLGCVHRSGLIHHDIKPENLVWNRATDRVQIIDFNLATAASQEAIDVTLPVTLGGTPHYLAPEQTGRLGRLVDYRCDFYAFGVTLYELLTGRRPFESSDFLELVHAHIARVPTPPDRLEPGLPASLSAVVLKLLAKNPDERYQSVGALVADLAECLRTESPFELGRGDLGNRFRVPDKLYGRRDEILRLHAAVDATVRGQNQTIVIAGDAGIGKSALVTEIQAAVASRRGAFSRCKFEPLRSTSPNQAIRQICHGLVRLLLTESEADLVRYRTDAAVSLHGLGRALTDVVGELETVLGPQPDIAPLPPLESQNRFVSAFQALVRLFASGERLLTLFADDVQWADNASLTLLESLVRDTTIRRFCLVVAYRTSEIRSGSRVEQFLERLRQRGHGLSDIALSPLDVTAVTSLVSETFHVDSAEGGPLAAIVHARTGGNPFFVREFLTSLVDGRRIRFEGRWGWDLAAIEATGITDNVASLVADRLIQFPSSTRELLTWAACVGQETELELLARLSGKSVDAVYRDLQPAMASGAVHVAGKAIRFGHDKVIEAADSLIEPEARTQLHRAVGEALLASGEEKFFDAVDHLNLASSELAADGRARLAELDRQAAYRARAAYVFDAASDYFARSAELRAAQEQPPPFDFAFQVDWAETAYMAGRYDLAERKLLELLGLTTVPEERLRVFKTLSSYYEKTYRFADAVAVSIEALAAMNVVIPPPESIGPEAIDAQRQRLTRNLATCPIEQLPSLPPAKDASTCDAVALLLGVAVPLWAMHPQALLYVLFEATNLSMERGAAPATGATVTMFGATLCFGLGQHEMGRALAVAGLGIQARHGDPYFECLTQFMHQVMVQFYDAPAIEARAPLLEAQHRGIETGNRQWASYCVNHYTIRGFLVGLPLATVESEIERSRQVLKRLDQEDAIGFFEPLRHIVAALRGKPDPPWELVGKTMDEAGAVAYLAQQGQEPSLSHLRIGQLFALCVAGDFEAARAFALANEGAIFYPTGQLQTELGVALFAVALVRGPRELGIAEASRLDAITARFARLAALCPANIEGYARLIEAERKRANGDDHGATRAYEQAIDAFEAANFMHLVAFASELAGRHWLALGHGRAARAYLADCRELYARWGADPKVQRLDAELAPRLLAPGRSRRNVVSTSSSSSQASIDVRSLLKATQAINGEIVLERLVATLLRIVLENAGAQRACLLLEEGGELRLAAQTEVDSTEAIVMQSVALTDAQLPSTVIYYVARMREAVSLVGGDPATPFASDPYFAAARPASVLAAPILHKGRLSGVLYLENSLVEGAFTSRHLEVLDLLTGQIASSLENARLYADLESQAYALAQSNRTIVAEVAERERAESALHASEEQLRQAQKMEALGLLAGGVAHDFNNLLTVIGLCSSLLGKSLPAEGPLRDYLEQIRQAGETAVTITRQLLAFSRRQVRAPQVLDLGAAVAQLVPMLRRLLGEDIDVAFDTPVGEGTIFADSGQIEQVVLNLAVNARDAMPRGGRLAIETRAAVIDDAYARGHLGATTGLHVRLSVRDTGIGMDGATLARIFEPFFTTKEVGKGTGLGLSTVFGIVEQSGGHIAVESEVGKGTTFQVFFPTIDPCGLHTVATASDAPTGGSETILLVEDNEAVRALAREILGANGYTVLAAADGPSALALSASRDGPIDLLLTDLVMPRMSGRELAERLRKERLEMRVLYMSGHTDDAIVRHGVVAASASFLQKPFSPTSLLSRARQVLDRPPNEGQGSEEDRVTTGPGTKRY
jgi:predicted ATPase/signal transduction histidine kinase/ActR/RegA family two-component response regulator